MVSQTRATPQSCKLFFCNSNPLAVKSHSLCPKHYQRYRRHDGNVLDNDTQRLLQWLNDNLVPYIVWVLKNRDNDDPHGWRSNAETWGKIETALKSLDELNGAVAIVKEGE